MRVAISALFKNRESVKYVKGLESRMKTIDECIVSFGNIDTSVEIGCVYTMEFDIFDVE